MDASAGGDRVTPAEFAEVVIVPTVRDFLAHSGDRRRAYLACITVFHLVDHIAHAESVTAPPKDTVREAVKGAAELPFVIVQGVCNGTKHFRSSKPVRFAPGDEIPAQRSSLVPIGGLFRGKLFAPPGETETFTPCLLVHHDRRHWEIDECVKRVLRAFVVAFPRHLGSIDLSFLDPP